MRTDTPLRAEPALCMICPAAATLPFRDPPRCDGPSFAGSAPAVTIHLPQNKNQSVFATFLRLGAPLRLCKAKNSHFTADRLRFYDPVCGWRNPQQSLIAKKLQHGPIFCFWALKDSFKAVPLWESARFGAIGQAHCGAAEVAEMRQGGGNMQRHSAMGHGYST